MPGGVEGFTALHFCVDMHATQSLRFHRTLPDVDLQAVDKKGRTFAEVAKELGYSSMVEDVWFFNHDEMKCV